MTTYNAKHNEEEGSLDLTDNTNTDIDNNSFTEYGWSMSLPMVDLRKLDTSKIKTLEDLLEIIQALEITIDLAQYPQLKKYAE